MDAVVNRGAEERRVTWGRKAEFVLSCIGYAVGMGNIWRFPYLCTRNGGGAFLIPYAVSLLLCGIPVFYVELYLGQFSSRGVTKVWNICPIFKGLGWGTMIYSIAVNYYDILLTLVLYYLYHSFSTALPWSSCGHQWNTQQCQRAGGVQQVGNITQDVELKFMEEEEEIFNYKTNTSHVSTAISDEQGMSSPGKEFFERKVLEIHLSSGIESLGGVKWDIFLFYCITYPILYACLCKGVKSVGKVVYVTATAPYVLLVVLLIRGVTLPGAMDGILYFIRPDFSRLLESKVWAEANLQVFFSLGVSYGGLITVSSYNKFSNRFYKDAVVVSLVNACTSMLGGFVIFSVIGFMAGRAGLKVEEVIKSGPALAFIAYPEALSQMPFAPFWSVLFFLTLVTVALDSIFVTIETITSGFEDRFPILRKHKMLSRAAIMFVLFLLGIPCTTRGGMYVFQLVDWYAGCICLILIALVECLVVAWIYGHERFYYDVECMTGSRPSLWWKICLCSVTPLILLISLIYVLTSMTAPYYGNYRFPEWAIAIGWGIACMSVIPLPIGMVHSVLKQEGSITQRLRKSLKPSEQWGPANREDRVRYKYCKEYSHPSLLLHEKKEETS